MTKIYFPLLCAFLLHSCINLVKLKTVIPFLSTFHRPWNPTLWVFCSFSTSLHCVTCTVGFFNSISSQWGRNRQQEAIKYFHDFLRFFSTCLSIDSLLPVTGSRGLQSLPVFRLKVRLPGCLVWQKRILVLIGVHLTVQYLAAFLFRREVLFPLVVWRVDCLQVLHAAESIWRGARIGYHALSRQRAHAWSILGYVGHI